MLIKLYCLIRIWEHTFVSLSYFLLISGMDRSTAYTKNDLKVLKGSSELRRQVKLPKVMLGYCTPLALETNGQ